MTNGADPLFQALQQTVCLSDTSLVIKIIGLQYSPPQLVYFYNTYSNPSKFILKLNGNYLVQPV